MGGANILISIAGLVLLVVIHELGHFSAARLLGLRVERFSLFFGPAMLRRRIGQTEFSIGTIPLGGFVKLAGMRRPDPASLAATLEPKLGSEPAQRRLRPLLNELELARSYREAHSLISRIEELLASAPLTLADGGTTLETRAQLNAEVAELRSLSQRDFWWLAPAWKRALVLGAGPAINILLAFCLMTAAFGLGIGNRQTTEIVSVVTGEPASAAGVQAGDRLVAVDGVAIEGTEIDLLATALATGTPLELTLSRAGQERDVRLRPTRSEHGFRAGIQFGQERDSRGLAGGASAASAALWRATALSGQLLVGGGGEGELMSPVGVIQFSASALQENLRAYLGVLALLSLSLAFFNLLPVPPLDGGQLALVALEKIRRRRLTAQTEAAFLLAGIGLVLLLFIAGLSNDLG